MHAKKTPVRSHRPVRDRSAGAGALACPARSAKPQACEAVSELIPAHARDILHRSDETSSQAQEAIRRLSVSGYAACSADELALMRHMNLTFPYIQGVGRVKNGLIGCSSLGDAPFYLGKPSVMTGNGALVYAHIPLDEAGQSPLFALERGGFAVLIHRALPLDTWTAVPNMSLGVFQLDQPLEREAELAHGEVRRAWLTRLGAGSAHTVFADGSHVVAVVRSSKFRIAAVAAVPASSLQERTHALALRIVPAGALTGLALATAILLLARRQRSLAAEIGHAIRHDEFFIEYQPVVELASGACIGAEALLRWRRSTGELLGPDVFIPVAEQSGTITQLTASELRLVARDSGAFLAANPGFHVAVNLSAADIHSDAVAGLLDRFLAETGAAPANLVVEITERGFLDLSAACSTIATLRARGLAVAIDDFGTGYSSLSYLESLELDILKIDRSFVEAIGTTAPTNQVVRHIIAMARARPAHGRRRRRNRGPGRVPEVARGGTCAGMAVRPADDLRRGERAFQAARRRGERPAGRGALRTYPSRE